MILEPMDLKFWERKFLIRMWLEWQCKQRFRISMFLSQLMAIFVWRNPWDLNMDFNGEVHEAKRESSGLKGTTIRRRLEEGNAELEKSPNVNSEVYDSQKSSDK
ncbi:hypothetical protein KFK09_021338 [Dendrobium nobile]|uniref:Uncharacterized protein n=1 Tax=Dendrobium nobile TaxID=94219 RepID=A0A8T3APK9_DENNO|nr:hypothetical protein KFK09_021338 [Dendrobium nobile]